MPSFLGWLVILVLFLVAQQRFYEIHRRHHEAWRSGAGRWSAPNADELRAMMRATFRADPVPEVERARRLYLLVVALAVAYLFAIAFGAL
jgi:ferric-dicitrate binding protein FerR (iron transport regulator)